VCPFPEQWRDIAVDGVRSSGPSIPSPSKGKAHLVWPVCVLGAVGNLTVAGISVWLNG